MCCWMGGFRQVSEWNDFDKNSLSLQSWSRDKLFLLDEYYRLRCDCIIGWSDFAESTVPRKPRGANHRDWLIFG